MTFTAIALTKEKPIIARYFLPVRNILKADSVSSTVSVKAKEKHFSSKENVWGIILNDLEGGNVWFWGMVVICKRAWWLQAWPVLAAPPSLLHHPCSAAHTCISPWTAIWALRSAAAYAQQLSSSAFQTHVLNPFHQFYPSPWAGRGLTPSSAARAKSSCGGAGTYLWPS